MASFAVMGRKLDAKGTEHTDWLSFLGGVQYVATHVSLNLWEYARGDSKRVWLPSTPCTTWPGELVSCRELISI